MFLVRGKGRSLPTPGGARRAVCWLSSVAFLLGAHLLTIITNLLWSVEFGKERARKGDRPGPMHGALCIDSKFVCGLTPRTCQEVAVNRSNHLPGLRKTTRVRGSILIFQYIIPGNYELENVAKEARNTPLLYHKRHAIRCGSLI
jgi:hypothetical protein